MIPVKNDTAMPIYVGAEMVPPGETRLFHDWLVPAHLRPVEEVAPVEEAADETDAVTELFEKNAKDVIAGLDALDDAQLERLGDMEQAKGDEARKTVLAAVAGLSLKRAETNKP